MNIPDERPKNVAPRLSIITATYNSEKSIIKTINSLNEQTYQDYEHIIIDGGSIDDTVKLAKKSSLKNPIIISQKDDGIYTALNKGISLSCGEYIGFLHSDDVYSSVNVIKELIDVMNTTNPDIIYGDLVYVSSKNHDKVIRKWISGPFSQKQLKFGWMPPHPTFFMKKEIYEKYGCYNQIYSISGDYDAMVRYLKLEGLKIVYINKVLIKMALGGLSNSRSNIIVKWRQDYAILLEHNFNPIVGILFKNFMKLKQFLR